MIIHMTTAGTMKKNIDVKGLVDGIAQGIHVLWRHFRHMKETYKRNNNNVMTILGTVVSTM